MTGRVLKLDRITKRFGSLVANDAITLELSAGEVLALLGENGAGKSTLVSILFGHYLADEGSIEAFGAPLPPGDPAAALAAGIGMVHQHSTLADNLTVLDNVMLGTEPLWRPVSRRRAGRARLVETARRFGLPVDPDARVADLSVGERQRVEILKALYREARVLILDEPTAVLTPQESESLFETLRGLCAQGLAVIFISHKLDEVLAISDDITVIRDGTTVATVKPADVDKRRLGELMVGSELPLPDTQESTVTPVVELSVRGVDAPATDDDRIVVKGVSFDIHQGEIVGIAGVEGNGQFELVEAILGLRPLLAGSVLLGSTDLAGMDVKERHHAGIGYIPFDRHREGLLLAAPLWENMILGHDDSPRFSHGLWISATSAQAECDEAIARFDVATPVPT